jgi:hypothetical protein
MFLKCLLPTSLAFEGAEINEPVKVACHQSYSRQGLQFNGDTLPRANPLRRSRESYLEPRRRDRTAENL